MDRFNKEILYRNRLIKNLKWKMINKNKDQKNQIMKFNREKMNRLRRIQMDNLYNYKMLSQH